MTNGDDLHNVDHFSTTFSPGVDVTRHAFGAFNPWDPSLYLVNREWATFAGLLRDKQRERRRGRTGGEAGESEAGGDNVDDGVSVSNDSDADGDASMS